MQRPAVEDRSPGGRLPPREDPQQFTQAADDGLEAPGAEPVLRLLVDDLSQREVVRQHPLGAPERTIQRRSLKTSRRLRVRCGTPSIKQVFKVALVRAGLPKAIRLYDLRHTSATLLLKAGEHIKVVSERLGHASVSITLEVYIHVLPGMQEGAASRIDALLQEPLKKGTPEAHPEAHPPAEAEDDLRPNA